MIRIKNWVVLVLIAISAGCYSMSPVGEDLDGQAREIASRIRYSKVLIEETPPVDAASDLQWMKISFYYNRQPVQISFKKHIIPAMYREPGPGRISGIAEAQPSAAAARTAAEDAVLLQLIDIACRNGNIGLDAIPGTRVDILRSIEDTLKAEGGGVYEAVERMFIKRHDYYVTPEIDPTYGRYLVNGKVLDARYLESYYNSAVLLELDEEILAKLTAWALPIVEGIAMATERTALSTTAAHLLGPYYENKRVLLGRDVPEAFFTLPLDEMIKRTRIIKISHDEKVPSLRIQAQVRDGDGYYPLPGASVIVNGKTATGADRRGEIVLEGEELRRYCLSNAKVTVTAKLKFFDELAGRIEPYRGTCPRTFQLLKDQRFVFSFPYRGKAVLEVGMLQVLVRKSGLIFKKIRSLQISGQLREKNSVAVSISKCTIVFKFFGESKRRAMESITKTRPVNLEVRAYKQFLLDISDDSIISKVNDYKSISAEIVFSGMDANGNAVSVTASLNEQF
jgi:hypothetical protein